MGTRPGQPDPPDQPPQRSRRAPPAHGGGPPSPPRPPTPPSLHRGPAPPWAHEAPWHVLSRASIIRRLQSSPITGLTTADARARLAWLGPNRVPAVPGKSTGQIVLEQLTSMPVLLLGVAAALSVLTGGLVDAVVILAVVLLNTGIGSIMESPA